MTIKEMTLGATVNLRNFENLRVEIKTSVNDAKDIAQTKQLLDDVLDMFGNNDKEAKKSIDSYRSRVLKSKEVDVTPENCEAKGTPACDNCPDAPKEKPPHGVDSRKRMTFNKPAAKTASATLTSGPTAKKVPAETQSGRKAVPGIKFKGNLAGQETGPSTTVDKEAKAPKKTDDDSKCSICGATLRPNETKFSKTMTGRDDICKVCAISEVKESRRKLHSKNKTK